MNVCNWVRYEWRGDFANEEINRLRAEALETEVFEDWDAASGRRTRA
jgi:hypothetical protein